MKTVTKYRNSFNMKLNKGLTKSDLVKMCKILTENLNIIDKTNIEVTLENDGGFKLCYKEEKKWCKSFRFILVEDADGNSYNIDFPSISMKDWYNSDEEIYCSKRRIKTWITSFNNTPVWSKNELETFKECFSQFDIKCY